MPKVRHLSRSAAQKLSARRRSKKEFRHFLRNKGTGWVTAEYAMLPRATNTRTNRETMRPSGRTQEIQRLIGRSLRAVVDMKAFGERQIFLDCDVIQADGGTRCASITGAYVALVSPVRNSLQKGNSQKIADHQEVAAVSVGMVENARFSI